MTSAASRLTHGRGVWTELLKVIEFGHRPAQVFEDWLDLAIAAHLSVTDNFARKGPRLGRLDGRYEERIVGINSRYPEPRSIVAFDTAYDALSRVVRNRGADALGDIYDMLFPAKAGTQRVAATPTSVRTTVSKIRRGEQSGCLLDPACGSGRMLIAAHKLDPDAELWGIDDDRICAKTCALNMLVFGFRAGVVHGNVLIHEYRRLWRMCGGFVAETDVEEQSGHRRMSTGHIVGAIRRPEVADRPSNEISA